MKELASRVLIHLFLLSLWLAIPTLAQKPSGSPSSVHEKVEQSQPWFDVYEIFPGVFAIQEPGHWQRALSYLLLGEEKALLFDTGNGIGDMKRLVEELTPLEAIVLNSHSHPDHIGDNHAFETLYGVDTDYGRESARGRSVEDSRWLVPERAFMRQEPPGFERESFHVKPYEIDHYVTDGEVIDLGGRRLEVVLTPGHSPDSLCLLDREQRFLLTGDTFYLGRLFGHGRHSDPKAYAASAKRLSTLRKDVDRLLPAHSATLLKSDFLSHLHQAFRKIEKGKATSKKVDEESLEYLFGGFSIVLPVDAF